MPGSATVSNLELMNDTLPIDRVISEKKKKILRLNYQPRSERSYVSLKEG